MLLRILKAKRLLLLLDGEMERFRAPIALGQNPIGAKTREGDGKTPEGIYHICLVKESGKYGKSLGLDYPSPRDARLALLENRIDSQTCRAILDAHRHGIRPPWGTSLGGEIYLHEGDVQTDWTQGCVALTPEDMAQIFALRNQLEKIEILP